MYMCDVCTQLCVYTAVCTCMYVYSVNYWQFRRILLAQEASYEMSSLRAKHFFYYM